MKYLVIHNISKKGNIEALMRCAAVFGFTPLLIDRTIEIPITFQFPLKMHDSAGQELMIEGTKFNRIAACVEWLKERGVLVVGIEIAEQAISSLAIDRNIWPNIAFIPGNEGTGLGAATSRLCDEFVCIPQYGSGTASLNVHVATALVLHRYCCYTPGS